MGDDYTDEEWSFMRSIEEYKRKYKRPFPTSREVLAVAKSLGYRVVAQAIPDKPANHKAIMRSGRRFKK
jgi:hypothetical protein